MREANDRGYDCLLVEDGTESYFPEFKEARLEMIRAQGAIVGWTATTDQVLEGLAAAEPQLSPASSTAAGGRSTSSRFATASPSTGWTPAWR